MDADADHSAVQRRGGAATAEAPLLRAGVGVERPRIARSAPLGIDLEQVGGGAGPAPVDGDIPVVGADQEVRIQEPSQADAAKPRAADARDGSRRADTGELGSVDPALQARWGHEFAPTAQVLEPSLIEEEKLDPLLSTAERPLIHLPQGELEAKLPEILGNADDDE